MLTEQEKAEGWIEWKGGKCPVDPTALVYIKTHLEILEGEAQYFEWKHGKCTNILAYKLFPGEQAEPTKTLWDEYAMAVLTGLCTQWFDALPIELAARTVEITNAVMEERRKRDGILFK